MIREFFTGIAFVSMIISLPLTIILHSMGLLPIMKEPFSILAYAVFIVMAITGLAGLCAWRNESGQVENTSTQAIGTTYPEKDLESQG
jgi:hypothetical protein